MSKVNYEQAILFFGERIDKDTDDWKVELKQCIKELYPEIEQYKEELDKKDNYIKLFKDFRYPDQGRKDNIEFIKKFYSEEDNISQNIKDVNDEVMKLEAIMDVIYCQQWHLIVSYLMFKLHDDKNLNDVFNYYIMDTTQCPELMLWMIGKSGVRDIHRYKKILTRVSELTGSNVDNRSICREIRKEVPWADIAKIIIEQYPLTKDNEDK